MVNIVVFVEGGVISQQNPNVQTMVQEMEAWILSQPDIIEGYCTENFIRSHPARIFSEDTVFKLNPEDIVSPSDKLNVVLARYFQIEKFGQFKKVK